MPKSTSRNTTRNVNRKKKKMTTTTTKTKRKSTKARQGGKGTDGGAFRIATAAPAPERRVRRKAGVPGVVLRCFSCIEAARLNER